MMYFWSTITIILSICSLNSLVLADTPANCTYEDIRGYWLFEESEPINDRNEDCSRITTYPRQVYVHLDYPNNATDKFGNKGRWTIIYNQGFEVIINYRRYFAFSQFHEDSRGVVSDCNKIKPGWSHDVLGNNWACYKGQKVEHWNNAALLSEKPKQHPVKPLYLETVQPSNIFSQQQIDIINSNQKLWKAKAYPHLQAMSSEELIRISGGKKSIIVNRPKPAPVTEAVRKLADSLPENFDWRNVGGVNYVSPVRNQGHCGSCYIFASMAQLESKIRIATNNTQKPIFSVQEVLDCSQYSQGCDGGFPYLIGGKYAQDYGVIEEPCYPYEGVEGKCNHHTNTSTRCKRRTYTVQYHYVGGYYGGCNEELMRLELVRNGPLVVAFEVYPDFGTYRKGIYVHSKHHDFSKVEFNPFELTNHAVVVVGYGVENGEKYWIVKNSWGTNWGLDGYFKIRRGTDECGIESLAMSATPIPY